jgi:hypothetical protein
MGIGAWAEVRYGDFVDITSFNYVTASRLVIAVGVIVAVVSFLGCCGAWKESKCMLYVVSIQAFLTEPSKVVFGSFQGECNRREVLKFPNICGIFLQILPFIVTDRAQTLNP